MRALGIVALVGLGCAPTLSNLVAQHNHSEALCAATLDGAPEAARDRVRAMLVDDLEPSIHVSAFTREQLGPFGPEGQRLADTYEMVQVTTWTRPHSVDLAFRVTFRGAREVPLELPALAGITGEPLPGYRRETLGPTAAERLNAASGSLGGLAAGVGELLTLGTIPFLQIFGFVRSSQSTEIAPTEAEYRARAPVAYALFASLTPETDAFQGRRRTGHLLLVRPNTQVWAEVTLDFVAHSGHRPCHLTQRATIDLGTRPLAGPLAARFGTRVRALQSLDAQNR